MPINRTNYNALVDDDGSNLVGSPIVKTTFKDVLLDPIDAALTADIAAGVASEVTARNAAIVTGVAGEATARTSAITAAIAALGGTTAWTPTIGGTTSQSGQTYAGQFGLYTRIGKLVFVQGNVTLSAVGTITGTVQIKGLPVAAANAIARSGAFVPYFAGMTTPIVWLGGFIAANATAITLTYRATAGGAVSSPVQADLGASLDLIFFATYLTD